MRNKNKNLPLLTYFSSEKLHNLKKHLDIYLHETTTQEYFFEKPDLFKTHKLFLEKEKRE